MADRVQLAYASTIHAAQGGTRDVAHTILTPRSTRTSVYVGLTRGRHENNAYVVCSRPEGGDVDGPADDPLAVLAAIVGRPDGPERFAALDVQADEATRAVSLATLFPIWQDLLAHHSTGPAEAALSAIGGPDLTDAAIASPAWPALAARLRRLEHAGIDPAANLAAAAAQAPLDDVDDLAHQTGGQIAVLQAEIAHTASVRPAQTEADQTVNAERAAADRITHIRAALGTTSFRRHRVRGDESAQLTAELGRLRLQHPGLIPDNPTIRWDSLSADARTADHRTLGELRTRHHQAVTDLDWYTNTAIQLRADADNQQQTISSIRTELARRTAAPVHPPARWEPTHPSPATRPQAKPPRPAQDHLASSPEPPQVSPGIAAPCQIVPRHG